MAYGDGIHLDFKEKMLISWSLARRMFEISVLEPPAMQLHYNQSKNDSCPLLSFYKSSSDTVEML